MPSSLTVRFAEETTSSSFVRQTKIDVFIGSSRATTTVRTGAIETFTIAPDTDRTPLTLSVTVPAPGNSGDVAIGFQQQLLVRRNGNRVTLEPVAGPLHGRLTIGGVLAGSGNLPSVSVDLAFIDLTDIVRLPISNLFSYDTALPAFPQPSTLRPGDQAFAPKATLPPIAPHTVLGGFALTDAHYGCTLRIYEYTQGRPKAWVVVLPQLSARRSSYHVLHFLRSASPQYADVLGLRMANREVIRFLCDPPQWAPFFIEDKGGDPSYQQFPSCGFEAQLGASGLPIVFAMPIPHSTDYGLAVAAGLRGRYAALFRALWSDGRLAPGQPDRPTVGRLAIAGHSRGADEAIDAMNRNRSDTDELYVFDPASSKLTLGDATAFLRGNDKRLRMLGGKSHDALLGIETGLGKTFPRNLFSTTPVAGFYDDIGSLYHVASFPPGVPLDLLTAIQGATRMTKLSTDSAVFCTPSTPGHVTMEWRDASGSHNTSEVECSVIEAACAAHRWAHENPRRPVGSGGDFTQLKVKIAEVRDGRHQWVVCGGDGDAFRRTALSAVSPVGAPFVGYLLKCLLAGSFP
jgi:hypothetical protein